MVNEESGPVDETRRDKTTGKGDDMRAHRNGRTRVRVTLVTGLLTFGIILVTALPSLANAISMTGAMEGNLLVSPGDTIQAGYSLKMDGSHPAAQISLLDAKVTFDVECASNPGVSVGTIEVALSSGPYDLPENDNQWAPTNDKDSPLSYQGSTIAPDLCSGGQMSLVRGGTFSADLVSTTTDKVILRFHYSANGSAGAWSRSEQFDPDGTVLIPVGQLGFLGLVLLTGIAFAMAQHRSRRAAQTVQTNSVRS
jgi:hypothetical protein